MLISSFAKLPRFSHNTIVSLKLVLQSLRIVQKYNCFSGDSVQNKALYSFPFSNQAQLDIQINRTGGRF